MHTEIKICVLVSTTDVKHPLMVSDTRPILDMLYPFLNIAPFRLITASKSKQGYKHKLPRKKVAGPALPNLK